MDLEWNNSYNKFKKCFVNEILEIGAVMVDDELEVIDTFSVIIKSQLIKKLSGRVKNLTHIINQAWVPWYTMHKIIEGLLCAVELNPKSLDILSGLTDWIYNRVSKWDDSTKRTVLGIEYGK